MKPEFGLLIGTHTLEGSSSCFRTSPRIVAKFRGEGQTHSRPMVINPLPGSLNLGSPDTPHTLKWTYLVLCIGWANLCVHMRWGCGLSHAKHVLYYWAIPPVLGIRILRAPQVILPCSQSQEAPQPWGGAEILPFQPAPGWSLLFQTTCQAARIWL